MRRGFGARVRRLAAKKKSDHAVGAASDDMPLQSNVTLSGPQNVFVLYCPTYLPRQQAPKSIPRRDHLREQSNVFFRGVREKVFLSAAVPMFWRRVVFYMSEEFEPSRPIYPAHPATGNLFRVRNMVPFLPQVGEPDEQIGRQLWAGIPGVDFTEATRWKTPLDSDKLTVVSDKTETINPNSPRPDATAAYGKNMQRKMWHPMNRSIEYGDRESGQDVNPSPWVSEKPRQGNMYVLDIFSTGHDVGGGTTIFGNWNINSTIYWHED